MMEKITLEPGVWTLVEVEYAVQLKSIQSGIRLYIGDEEPVVDTEAYFSIPEFDRGFFPLPGLPYSSDAGPKVYMMPDEDQSIDIVTW